MQTTLYPLLPIPFKPPRLIALSERRLTEHYERTYGGLVRRINAYETSIPSQTLLSATAEQCELLNSAVLHEAFFECLGGEEGTGGPAAAPAGAVARAIESRFGSVRNWQTRWIDAANRAGDWLVLYWDQKRLCAGDVALQGNAQLPHCWRPLMAIPLGAPTTRDAGDNATYVAQVFDNLNWARMNRRLTGFAAQVAADNCRAASDSADRISVEALQAVLQAEEAPVILDVCLPEDRPRRYDRLPGAVMLTPDELLEYAGTMDAGHPVVIYCLYGYQVSAQATELLRKNGIGARRLGGGITAWHALGGQTEKIQ